MINIRLQTNMEAVEIVPDKSIESELSQTLNPEKHLAQEEEKVLQNPENQTSEDESIFLENQILTTKAQSQKDPSTSELFAKEKNQDNFSPDIIKSEVPKLLTPIEQMTPQSEILNIENSPEKSKKVLEESKTKSTPDIAPSISHSMSMTTINQEQLKEEINRMVQRQIRMLNKPISKSKISHQLGISFGKLPGLTEEQQAIIDEKIEQKTTQEIVIQDKLLDMIFLYSKPLVTRRFKGTYKIEQCNQRELEIDEEYQILKKTIHQHCISFSIIKQNATRRNLREIMSKGVKILHIVCHGYDDQNQDSSKLYFEHSKYVGVQDDKFGVSKVNDIFNENFQHVKLKLILVAACHSEEIAKEIKKKVGNTIVIAINKSNAVLDKSATIFAKEFYDKILGGKTPQDSFDFARKCLRQDFRTLACCCQHKSFHEPSCPWNQKLCENKKHYLSLGFDPNKAQELAQCDACCAHDPLAKSKCNHEQRDHSQRVHFKNIPECSCGEDGKEKNCHSDQCLFYKNFYDKYQHKDDKFRPEKTPKHVCCCQKDDFPHNEDEKFKIIYGQSQQQKDIEEEKRLLDTPLYKDFLPGDLVDDQGKQLQLPSLKSNDLLMLIERNVEIYNVTEFLSHKLEKNNIYTQNFLSVLGTEETGNYEIVAFALYYCKERNIIKEAIYFDLSQSNCQDMMDRLNISLSLNVPTSRTEKKYIQSIIEKINDKLKIEILPIVLIFDNLNNQNKNFENQQNLLKKLKEKLIRIKMIVIERRQKSSIEIQTNTLIFNNFNFGQEKVGQILSNIGFQKKVQMDYYFKFLSEVQFKTFNNNNKMIRFVEFIQLKQAKAKYIQQPELLIKKALESLDKSAQKKNQSNLLSLMSQKNLAQKELEKSNANENRCLACYQKLYLNEDQDDQNINNVGQELNNSQSKQSNKQETKKKMEDYLKSQFPQISYQKTLIDEFRENNPFIFQGKEHIMHIKKFLKMNNDDCELENVMFDMIDGRYHGDIKKGTRIQHGRGIFIEKVVKKDDNDNKITIFQSVYEGWRVKNKREIYGRLIDANGLIYEGEFKNNMPHGNGKVTQIDTIQGIYPRGFQFNGYFQNGIKEQWGIMKIPSDENKHQFYYGYFQNNMMDGIFTVINQDGDQTLENYDQDQLFRKFTAQVFTIKSGNLYGFIPQVGERKVNVIPRVVFNNVRKLRQQEAQKFQLVDIEQKPNQNLQEYQFSVIWLKYQAQNKLIILMYELLIGYYPQVESIFMEILNRVREKLQIQKKELIEDQESPFRFCMVHINKQKTKIVDQEIQHFKVDDSLVNKIIVNMWQRFNELLQQPQNTFSISERIINLLITDEHKNKEFIEILKVKQQAEKIQIQNSFSFSSSLKLYSNKSIESDGYQQQELPNQQNAGLLYKEFKEAEEMTLPIQEFINLSRLVEEQNLKTGQIYKVKNKNDIIYSLLNDEPPNLLKQNRIILGRAFLEMCVSMHYVNNPKENRIEEFMKQNVFELFNLSGYYQIAKNQQKFNKIKALDFQINCEESIIEDLLYLKNLKNIKKPDQDAQIMQEIDSDLITNISQYIGSKNNSDSIIEKALDNLNQRIETKQDPIIEQQETEQLGENTFLNFLGAIAQIIDYDQAVQFLLDLLQKHYSFESSKENEKKMKKLYDFRKMNELEKHVGYQFKDKNLLVQSLTHESCSQSKLKQQSLEKSGKLVVNFIVLREILLNHDDLTKLAQLNNSDLLKHSKFLSQLGSLLGLHSKLIYDKKIEKNYEEFEKVFETIISNFKLQNPVDNINPDFSSMIEYSVKILKTNKLDDKPSQLQTKNLFAFISAFNIDSRNSNKTYQSLVTLLPFIFIDTECYIMFKEQCVTSLRNNAGIISFPEIFRVSKEAFQAKSFSMNDCFNQPGKLFKIREFDIQNKESYKKLVDYITKLEDTCSHKLINIIFNDEKNTNANNYVESSYYIVHSHVVSVCLKKEDLLEKFITKMRNQAKQRVINSQQILLMTQEDTSSLTLAQKIKILMNLNNVQYQKSINEAEKLYQPPTSQEAMDYVKKLKILKENTYDSIIYTYQFKESNQGEKKNPLKPNGKINFIKQPLLKQHEGDSEAFEVIKKNQKYLYNNILENQLIQLSHFLTNQESGQQNELIILDEEQLRVVDYLAIRFDTQNVGKISCQVQVLSICFQIIALTCQSLHEFDVYHGNIKPDRIKLNHSGYDGFFYNGNLLILQPDRVVMKNIADKQIEEDEKKKLVNNIELYTVAKKSDGFCSQFMTGAIKEQKQLAKCDLYREETYQMVSTLRLIIRTVLKQKSQTPDQLNAKKVLEKIQKVTKEYENGINQELQMKTILDFQNQLAEDWKIANESVGLFRGTLKPTFSRNLWIYFDQISPLHPKLLQLVFPWKQFKTKFIDLTDFSQKTIESEDYHIINTESFSSDSQTKISILRNLHLSFIEDWWYEIAAIMRQSQDKYDKIDQNVLEYVKCMITERGERVKFDWLKAKVQIIKYFKAESRRQQNPQLLKDLIEESKNEGEIQQEEVEPEIILKNVYSSVLSLSGAQEKKARNPLKTLLQSSPQISQHLQDDYIEDQEQLRHFVNAAIYPLKDIHIKIYKKYGPECLKEYIKIIIEALEWINSDSFYQKMLEALMRVTEQSQVIKDLLTEIQFPSEEGMVEEQKGEQAVVQEPRLKLIRKIGQNLYNEVWLAKMNENQDGGQEIRYVEAKVCKTGQVLSLRHEFDTLRVIGRHPHIIDYIEFGENVDSHFDYLTYGLSQNLLEILFSQPHLVNERWSRFWFRQMLSALIHINHAGYSNLNIQCETFLLDDGLNVKISDFSFAQQNSQGININVGSEYYRAPEICKGVLPFDGEKADVFSLSIVLFVMTMKEFPTTIRHNVLDAPEYQLFMAHNSQYTWPLSPQVSDDFKDLFQRMFDQDPARRLNLQKVADHPWVKADDLPSQEEQHQEALKQNKIREGKFAQFTQQQADSEIFAQPDQIFQ